MRGTCSSEMFRDKKEQSVVFEQVLRNLSFRLRVLHGNTIAKRVDLKYNSK